MSKVLSRFGSHSTIPILYPSIAHAIFQAVVCLKCKATQSSYLYTIQLLHSFFHHGLSLQQSSINFEESHFPYCYSTFSPTSPVAWMLQRKSSARAEEKYTDILHSPWFRDVCFLFRLLMSHFLPAFVIWLNLILVIFYSKHDMHPFRFLRFISINYQHGHFDPQ